MAQQSLVGRCLLIIVTLRSHSTHTHIYLVGFLWTRDRPVAETSTWHTTLTRDRYHATAGIRTGKTSKWATAYPRRRPRDHRDLQWEILPFKILHTMYKQGTFIKTKRKITGWELARSPKSPLTSCQTRYEGDMSDHMFSVSDYIPSITVQPFGLCKNCTLCIKSSSNLEPLIYWKGPTTTSSACLIVCACVMNAGPQRCRHLGLNMTTHLHQVLKLMAQKVYWPFYELGDQGIVVRCSEGTRNFSLIFIVVSCILITSEFFSPTNAPFIEHIKC